MSKTQNKAASELSDRKKESRPGGGRSSPSDSSNNKQPEERSFDNTYPTNDRTDGVGCFAEIVIEQTSNGYYFDGRCYTGASYKTFVDTVKVEFDDVLDSDYYEATDMGFRLGSNELSLREATETDRRRYGGD